MITPGRWISIAVLAAVLAAAPAGDDPRRQKKEAGFQSLFDGKTLDGWHRNRRRVGHGTGGRWRVEDGAIVGSQDPPGNGGLLLSDETYGDFELRLEIRPDWGIDSGLFVRSTPRGKAFQVTVDYCPGGYVGQIYGEGLGGWNTRTFGLSGTGAGSGRVVNLDAAPRRLPPGAALKHGVTPKDWLRAWKPNAWNELRVRVTGQPPRITTWINGVKIVDVDTVAYRHPRFDRALVERTAPRRGHIAFQIHGGATRWREGARCRWRNVRIRLLDEKEDGPA